MKGSLRFLILALALMLFLGGGAAFAQDAGGSVTTEASGSMTTETSDPAGAAGSGTIDVDADVTQSSTTTESVTTVSEPASTTSTTYVADDVDEADGYGDEIFWAVVGLLVLGLIIWMFSAGSRRTTIVERHY